MKTKAVLGARWITLFLAFTLAACGPPGGGDGSVETPSDGATGVALDTSITLQYQTDLAITSVGLVRVRVANTAQDLPGKVVVEQASPWKITFTPDAPLLADQVYDVDFSGFETSDGKILPEETWSFITGTTPPPHYLPTTYDANGFFHLNSGQSDYVGYKPDTYDQATPISLFVWMHGCGGVAEGDLWSVAPAGSRATQSYIAISIGGRDGTCWSVGDDSQKVLSAIADIKRYFNINPRKIYLGGYSSGGDMTYHVGLQNPGMFAGLLVENSTPFRDSGITAASVSNLSTPINVAHLAHVSDTTYPLSTVRNELAILATKGYVITKIEKAGTHYDEDAPAGAPISGTSYDLSHFLIPYLDAGW